MSYKQKNNNVKNNTFKEGVSFVFIEFCIFAAQVLVIFIVAYFISDMLSSEERLIAFANGKINIKTMTELGLTIFALTFVLGLMTLIREVAPSSYVEKVSGEVLLELPRTI